MIFALQKYLSCQAQLDYDQPTKMTVIRRPLFAAKKSF